MNWIYLVFAFLVGTAISVQAGLNSSLRHGLNSPVLAATVSFGSGFFALVLFYTALRGSIPAWETIQTISWWKWLGGLLGAIYVTTVIITVPRVGAGNQLSLSVAGQLLAALILDHYGWLGFNQHPMNVWRLAGALLIVAGVLLVVKN